LSWKSFMGGFKKQCTVIGASLAHGYSLAQTTILGSGDMGFF
jgi:hypothetical protein